MARGVSLTLPPTDLSRRGFLALAGASSVVLASLGLTGCSSRSGVSSGKSGTHTIKLSTPSPAPLLVWTVSYVAEDKGYYKDEGLTVQRVGLGGGPAALSAVLSHDMLGDLSSPGELIASVLQKQKLKALFAYTNTNPAILVVSKRFAERAGVTASSPLADRQAAVGKVKGARYGITVPGSQSDAFIRLSLKQAGLNPSSDATIVPLQTLPNCLAALSKGRIDGFFTSSPTAELTIDQAGAVALLNNAAGDVVGGKLPQGQTLEVLASEFDAHHDVFAALVRAETRALKTLVDDPDGCRDLVYKTRFSSVPATIWPTVWEHNKIAWGSPYVTKDSLRAWFTAGLAGTPADADTFPYDNVIDMSLVDAAVHKLGWNPPHGS